MSAFQASDWCVECGRLCELVELTDGSYVWVHVDLVTDDHDASAGVSL